MWSCKNVRKYHVFHIFEKFTSVGIILLVPLATAKIEKKVAVTEYLFKQFHSKHCLNVSKAHGFLRYDTHFHSLDFL